MKTSGEHGRKRTRLHARLRGGPAGRDLEALRAVEQRVLWLSTSMIHHANRVRPNPAGLKVGGHQASCASMVVDHDLAVVRAAACRGPGVGQAARVAGAARHQLSARRARREVPDDAAGVRRPAELPEPLQGPRPGRLLHRIGRHRGDRTDLGRHRPPLRRHASSAAPAGGRQYSLVGDAELDEGAVWEAILDSGVADLGEIVWIVDLNRQSLDRVVPNIAAGRLEAMFAAAGWQVITVRFGRLLEELFARDRRGRAAHPHPRHAQPRIPAAAALHRRASCATGCPAPAPTAQPIANCIASARRRHARRRDPQPRRARPRRPARRVRADRRHPARR